MRNILKGGKSGSGFTEWLHPRKAINKDLKCQPNQLQYNNFGDVIKQCTHLCNATCLRMHVKNIYFMN